MDFWTTQGKLLFTGLLGAAALSARPSMHEVAKWVYDMTRPDPNASDTPSGKKKEKPCPPLDRLNAAFQNPATEGSSRLRYPASPVDLEQARRPDHRVGVRHRADRVRSVARPERRRRDGPDRRQGGVDRPRLAAEHRRPEGEGANTLYLLVSLDDYKRLAPVLAGLLSDLKSQAYEWDMQGRPFPAPLLMLIDEAGNMPLSWLPEVSSTCAGIGIQLVTVWQSLAQIHEAYGKRADILLTNHATKLFFPGASDDSTLGYVSKIVGDEEIERRSWSNDLGGGRRSISGQQNREPLVPYFLARLPKYGSALAHPLEPPARSRAGTRVVAHQASRSDGPTESAT